MKEEAEKKAYASSPAQVGRLIYVVSLWTFPTLSPLVRSSTPAGSAWDLGAEPLGLAETSRCSTSVWPQASVSSCLLGKLTTTNEDCR